MKNPFTTMAIIAAAMSAAFRENMVRDSGVSMSSRSRGKGRGTPSRTYGNPAGKYMPHQGAKECARRKRQTERAK